MAVAIKKWLNLHPGAYIENRVVERVQGPIGRDESGELACGRHYRKLQLGQSSNWSCPLSNCDTRIDTKLAS
ncbi:MAG: hypothetical protein ACE5HA_15875 [Anaerolineae bacterium]